jgi:type I restriction enzyme, S subunit
MSNTQNKIPKLRFPEFEGELSHVKLGSIAEFSKGKGISKADIDENGEIECIRYGELYTTYGEVIDLVYSRTSVQIEDLVLSKDNDVIIPASGESQIEIATASCVLKRGVALGGDLNIIRSSANGVFLSYYLNNRKKFDIARMAQGISVVHLYSSQLRLLKVNLPSLPEQLKIATFLTSIDARIQLLERKKAQLEAYKKGVMQELFSQRLRFKQEDGSEFPEWEEKNIEDVFQITRGQVLAVTKTKDIETVEYCYPVFSSQTKQKGLMGFYPEFLFEDAITWTTDGANAGDVNFRKGKFYCTNVCGVLLNNDGYCNGFVAELLNSVSHKYVSYVGNPKLMNNVMAKIRIPFPSLPEQRKIASFLGSLDAQIAAVGAQKGESKEFKRGLLQNMFV